ncbi:hypothetical protein [Arthrobacter sp.]|uniref:hypothetical protein n=1 Tax=Arthrobacter sp. TaxID=1667 RepID=UPI00339404E5
MEAAKSQRTAVPAQHMGERIVAALAEEILTFTEELAKLDALISEKSRNTSAASWSLAGQWVGLPESAWRPRG